MSLRLMWATGIMAVISAIWMLGAIGLWLRRSWAWWLALAMNGLAAAVTLALQIARRDTFLLDPLAIAAVVLLLLPAVKKEFPRSTRRITYADA